MTLEFGVPLVRLRVDDDRRPRAYFFDTGATWTALDTAHGGGTGDGGVRLLGAGGEQTGGFRRLRRIRWGPLTWRDVPAVAAPLQKVAALSRGRERRLYRRLRIAGALGVSPLFAGRRVLLDYETACIVADPDRRDFAAGRRGKLRCLGRAPLWSDGGLLMTLAAIGSGRPRPFIVDTGCSGIALFRGPLGVQAPRRRAVRVGTGTFARELPRQAFVKIPPVRTPGLMTPVGVLGTPLWAGLRLLLDLRRGGMEFWGKPNAPSVRSGGGA